MKIKNTVQKEEQTINNQTACYQQIKTKYLGFGK